MISTAFAFASNAATKCIENKDYLQKEVQINEEIPDIFFPSSARHLGAFVRVHQLVATTCERTLSQTAGKSLE